MPAVLSTRRGDTDAVDVASGPQEFTVSGTSNKETAIQCGVTALVRRPISLFAGGQIILFNTGVQPRIRDKQMLDGRAGEKEAGSV